MQEALMNEPIIIADAGPLIRLAAAGLLDSLRGLNRRIVLVDRVEDEACGDPSKPFAADIAQWLIKMGPAVQHARTVEGIGIATLRSQAATPEDFAFLKRSLRDSGERAIREFVEAYDPQDSMSVIVVYEDRDTPALMAAARVPMTLMTTRRFARQVAEWGVNVDAVAALEAVAGRYDLKPPIVTQIDPSPIGK
jgi:hypothetical protein